MGHDISEVRSNQPRPFLADRFNLGAIRTHEYHGPSKEEAKHPQMKEDDQRLDELLDEHHPRYWKEMRYDMAPYLMPLRSAQHPGRVHELPLLDAFRLLRHIKGKGRQDEYDQDQHLKTGPLIKRGRSRTARYQENRLQNNKRHHREGQYGKTIE